jgi:hypothetical protein
VANTAPTGEKENDCWSAVTDLLANPSRSIEARQTEVWRRSSNLGCTVFPARSERSKEPHSEDHGKHAPKKEEDLPRTRSAWMFSSVHGSDLTGVDQAPFGVPPGCRTVPPSRRSLAPVRSCRTSSQCPIFRHATAIRTPGGGSRNSVRMNRPWERTRPWWFPVESSPGRTRSAYFQATRGRISREPQGRRFG